MAQTARIDDTAPSPAWFAEPALEAVADVPAPAAATVEAGAPADPRFGRSAAIGAALGFAVATITITVMGTIGGIGAVNAFGLGAFVGIWGGAGFGFMMGGTIPLARHFDADHAQRPPTGRPS